MPMKKRTIPAAPCALFLAVLLTALCVCDYFAAANRVRSDVLRLHIIANSDGATDQAVKLLVRDRLLAEADALFGGGVTPETAPGIVEPALPRLTEIAVRTLRENGLAYGAEAYLAEDYFDTRVYGDITLPAGTYTALRVVLGDGDGQNWWCVMFPPLCLPAAGGGDSAEAVFSEDEWRVLRPEKGYQVRFRLVEIYAWIKEKAEEMKR